jgi:hypothetical protein
MEKKVVLNHCPISYDVGHVRTESYDILRCWPNVRYLTMLAMLELRQHEALRRLQGMGPLDDSERAQYRANCFRASSARIATVMAKATIMRLTGATPQLQ